MQTRGKAPETSTSTALTLATSSSENTSVTAPSVSVAPFTIASVTSTIPPPLVSFSITTSSSRVVPSVRVPSSMGSDSSLFPLSLTTAIAPAHFPGAAFTVTTPYAVGYGGLITHFQQIQNLLSRTFWNPQGGSLPSAARPSAASTSRGRTRHQRYEPYARWNATPAQRQIMEEIYRRSGGQLPTWEESAQLAVLLREYGEIEGLNVYYWFRNHRVRGGQETSSAPAEPSSSSSPASGGLLLFPVQAGDLTGSSNPGGSRDIIPAPVMDDTRLTRLELRTRQTDD